MPFGVLVNRSGGRVLLGLSGDFSSEAGNRFEEAVEEITREPFDQLIVDLSGLTYLDQSSAFLIYELYKRFSSHASVMLEGGSAETQQVFESAGLTAAMPIAFPGAAHPAVSRAGALDHDWITDPAHPHHTRPYIGIPRPGSSRRHG
jgi:anti-anti-sigma factor